MSWRDHTDDRVLAWLQEPSYPSIRYFTLRHLLDAPAEDDGVVVARRAILAEGPGAEILARQLSDGSWLEEENAYNPLYKSSVWRLIFLAELRAADSHKRIERGVEHVLTTMQAPDGSFPSLGKYSGNLMCMEGQTIRALLRLGYGDDQRVRRGPDFLVDAVNTENHKCRYNKGVPCSWGAVKALRALVEVPEGERSAEIEDAIHRTGEFLANGDLARADYPPPRGRSASIGSSSRFLGAITPTSLRRRWRSMLSATQATRGCALPLISSPIRGSDSNDRTKSR